jgi:hypothetical protein
MKIRRNGSEQSEVAVDEIARQHTGRCECGVISVVEPFPKALLGRYEYESLCKSRYCASGRVRQSKKRQPNSGQMRRAANSTLRRKSCPARQSE